MRLIWQFLTRLTTLHRDAQRASAPLPTRPDKALVQHVVSYGDEETGAAISGMAFGPKGDPEYPHVFCPGELVG